MAGSPWGPIQQVEKVAHGVATVHTASHGGIRVSRALALKHLSEEARAAAIAYKDYFFFEGDCNWAIVAHEMPVVLEAAARSANKSLDEARESVVASLRQWNPQYAVKKGLAAESA